MPLLTIGDDLLTVEQMLVLLYVQLPVRYLDATKELQHPVFRLLQ